MRQIVPDRIKVVSCRTGNLDAFGHSLCSERFTEKWNPVYGHEARQIENLERLKTLAGAAEKSVQRLQGCRLAARLGLARFIEEGLDFVMPRREESIHLLVRQVFAQGGSDFAEIPAEFGVYVHRTSMAELAFLREVAIPGIAGRRGQATTIDRPRSIAKSVTVE